MSRITHFFRVLIPVRLSWRQAMELETRNTRVDCLSLLIAMSELLDQQQNQIHDLQVLAGMRNVARQARHRNCLCRDNRMPAEVEAGI